MRVAAIIVAAGAGKRFGGATPKQFLKLSGKPVFMHSVDAFKSLKFVKQIILVVPHGYKKKHNGITVALGGAERYNSVQNALNVLNKNIDIVAIHDAARPLVLKADIQAACIAAAKYGASLLAAPSTDSVKFSKSGAFVKKSIERRNIYMAQTPQVFKKDIILKAYAKMPKGTITDDVQLAEKFTKVKIIAPSGENFKITAPVDFARAKNVLKGRK